MSNAVIAYYRVSTAAQGRSALGLDAQRAAVVAFAAREGLTILAEHIEVETGKGADALARRPILREALAVARKAKAAVCVARLDRLSRDVAFISALMAQGIAFVVASLGRDVPDFMLHVYASLAQEERRLIAERTREALARKRARGEPLGNIAALDAGRAAANASNARAADLFAANILPIIREIQAAGHTSLRAIAAELTRRNIATARGGAWSADAVRAVLLRA
jgi:DNA invertase Pin-like site-specific DNA recombinase